jgi:VCBS repeat-containing protein
VPTEIHVCTVTDKRGALGILSLQTTEGRFDVALDRQTAAINAIRSKLELAEIC